MLLQSHRSFDTAVNYDPTTGRFDPFSRRAEPNRVAGQLSGVFDHIGGKRVLLYRLGDGLYLEIDGQRLHLETHVVVVQAVNGCRLLQVLSDGRSVIEMTYDPPLLDPPLSLDPTAFIEEEDFDFGLFLHNVSHDRSRQTHMYQINERA